jgi:hypothetical protein
VTAQSAASLWNKAQENCLAERLMVLTVTGASPRNPGSDSAVVERDSMPKLPHIGRTPNPLEIQTERQLPVWFLPSWPETWIWGYRVMNRLDRRLTWELCCC